jgi:hypothetical protein
MKYKSNVVYHIICGYVACVTECRGSVSCASQLSGTNQCSVGYFYCIDTLCGQNVELLNSKLAVHIVRAVLRTGQRGPGPGRQISRGGILKKSRLKYGMGGKKAVHEREI